ncbi:hypothetical protein V8G54_009604 [Vigna mungo]|uniref:Reverse transcriptase/retrotransposon-derived protein RNase H-like domain-containing protein n=1 Tax=Vigna mungo TaxID=3915 RepID=A0AAQ3S421_VIGMU
MSYPCQEKQQDDINDQVTKKNEYGRIAKPLTQSLTKNGFHWNEEAQQAFEKLKGAVAQLPVLAVTTFSKPFTIETDASSKGLGAVFLEEDKPLAFWSQAEAYLPTLANMPINLYHSASLPTALPFGSPPLLHRLASFFSVFLFGLTSPLPYSSASPLMNHSASLPPTLPFDTRLIPSSFIPNTSSIRSGHFIVVTDQKSLWFLNDQKLLTEEQFKLASKLIGFDFEIHYRSGRENKVADALSRKQYFLALSSFQTNKWEAWKEEVQQDSKLTSLIQDPMVDSKAHPVYEWKKGRLFYHAKLGSERILQNFKVADIKTLSCNVRSIKEIRQKLWLQQGYFSHYQFPLKSGQISQWIS